MLRSIGVAKLGAMAGLTAAVAGFFMYVMGMMTDTPKALLFSGLDPRDSSEIAARLETMKVPYELAGRRRDDHGAVRSGPAPAHAVRRRRHSGGRLGRLRNLRSLRRLRPNQLRSKRQSRARARRRTRPHDPLALLDRQRARSPEHSQARTVRASSSPSRRPPSSCARAARWRPVKSKRFRT